MNRGQGGDFSFSPHFEQLKENPGRNPEETSRVYPVSLAKRRGAHIGVDEALCAAIKSIEHVPDQAQPDFIRKPEDLLQPDIEVYP